MTIFFLKVIKNRPQSSWTQWLIFIACWAVLALFLIYPLLSIGKNSVIVNGKFTFEGFSSLIEDPFLLRIISNSIQLAVGVTITTTTISIPFALFLAHSDFIGRRVVLMLLAVPLLMPPFIGVIGLRQILGRFGSVNLFLMELKLIDGPIDWLPSGSAFAVGVLQVLHLYPIMVAQLIGSFEQQPASLHEAARSVGAGSLIRLFRITIPLALPSIISGATLVFVSSFTDLGTPLLFEYRAVLPVQIFNMLTDLNENIVGYALVSLVAFVSLGIFALGDLMTRANLAQRSVRDGPNISKKRLTIVEAIMSLIPIATLSILSIIPHLGIILLAISDHWFFTPLPESLTSAQLVKVFFHPLTLTGIRTSLGLACVSTILVMILGCMIGWLVSRSKLPAKSLLSLVSLSPLAIPGILFAFGYLGAFSKTVLDSGINPLPLLAIAYTIRRLPFMVKITSAGLSETSEVYEEAARSVGASPATVLKWITLPLLRRYIIAGAVLCFAFAMVEVSDSLILAREERFYPIAKVLYALTARPDGIAIASALGTIVMVLSAILLFSARKIRTKA